MSDKHNKIFTLSECPTHQMLRDYLDEKLSHDVKHQVEKHLLDCCMCSDELEGLSLMKEKDNLDMGLWKSVNKKDLILPLDTHTFQVSTKLGLLYRKSADLKSAYLITQKLNNFI